VRRLRLIALSCLTVLFAAGVAQAQVSARVDRQELTTDEQVELIVSVSGEAGGKGSPTLPALPDFTIASSGTTQSIQIVNGRMSTSVEYRYSLQPKRPGAFTIGPISVRSGGRTYKTQPITIRVTKGTGQPSAPPAILPLPSPFEEGEPQPQQATGEDVFVRATVDNGRVYVNQQVTYTFSFYRATNLWEAPHYQAPSTAGFWMEELPQAEPTQETIEGRQYVVERIRTALFPTAAGKQTIGPAKLTYRAGFFESGNTIQTKPITVEVLPLPQAGRPQGFSGAVGSWKAALTVKPQQVTVGDAVTAVVTITGKGNVQTVSQPELSVPPGLKQYEPSIKRTTAKEGATVRGTASFEHLLVPQQAGRFLLGPARLAYFDPEAGQYRVTETAAIPVVVSPRAGGGPTGAPPVATGAAPPADIRDIKPSPAVPTAPLGAPFVALQILPLALAAGAALYGRRRRRLVADPSYARMATARSRARDHLRAARRHRAAGDAKASYRCLHEAVAGYIADRLDLPQAVLGPEAARQRLLEAGVRQDLAQQAEQCLRAFDLGRFANSAGDRADMDQALALAENVLKALSRERISRE